MATLPPASDFTGGTVTEGEFKTAMDSLRSFLATLLGTDTASPLVAVLADANTFTAAQRVTSTAPAIQLEETDSGLAGSYAIIRQNGDATRFVLYNGTAEKEGYRTDWDTNGPTSHRWLIGGTLAYLMDNTVGNSANVITRSLGDARYTLASSTEAYKDAITEIDPPVLGPLDLTAWLWGGTLPEDDPRRGHPGSGYTRERLEAAGAPESWFQGSDGVNWPALVSDAHQRALRAEARLADLEARVTALEGV